MKNKVHKRARIIVSEKAAEFEEQINRILNEFPEAEIHFNDGLGLCAYVLYTFEEEIPEDARDVMRQRGVKLWCRECPKMEPPRDGRVRWCSCSLKPYGKTHIKSEACEYLYQAVMSGEIRTSDLRRTFGR